MVQNAAKKSPSTKLCKTVGLAKWYPRNFAVVDTTMTSRMFAVVGGFISNHVTSIAVVKFITMLRFQCVVGVKFIRKTIKFVVKEKFIVGWLDVVVGPCSERIL